MVSTGIVVLAIIALLIGAVGGFFLARKYERLFEKKSSVNEGHVAINDDVNGAKPSEKKIRQ